MRCKLSARSRRSDGVAGTYAYLRGCALILLLFLPAARASAGSVDVGLANRDEFDAWLCNGVMPPEKSDQPSSCGSAKFNECSSCEALVITNHTDQVVTPEIQVRGLGFSGQGVASLSPVALMGMACEARAGRKGGFATNSCYNLGPEKNCVTNIEFCPQQAGTTEAELKVSVGTGSTRKVTTFKLIGKADYPPALVAADEVRRRHLAELLKIPKVHWVALDRAHGKILIDVLVEQNDDGDKTPQDIAKVRRKVPERIEGYEVEVTEFIPTAYGL